MVAVILVQTLVQQTGETPKPALAVSGNELSTLMELMPTMYNVHKYVCIVIYARNNAIDKQKKYISLKWSLEKLLTELVIVSR